MSDLGERVAQIRDRIEAATLRSGRSAHTVSLVAVSKRVEIDRIVLAAQEGITLFGENYYQEAAAKIEALPELEWHFIGTLQRNKAKYMPGRFAMVQTVDSLDLARELGRRAQARGITVPVLLEVRLVADPSRSGYAPDAVADAAGEAATVSNIEVRGLMGIAPEEPHLVRPAFKALRKLFDALPPSLAVTLSMGMSSDYEAAIEEGSTMVRIGSALFGPRL